MANPKPDIDDLRGFPGDAEYDPELAKLLSQPEPEGWKPAVGDTIMGTVVDIETAGQESTFGSYPLVTVEEADGTLVAVHCFHTMLKSRIERAKSSGKLREGSRIGITYYGPVEGGGYGHFEKYRVVVLPSKADTTPF